MKEKILIKYHDKDMKKLEKISAGDWIDLYTAQDIGLFKGSFALISLGVSMILPEGYEALLVPRSSTFKRYGIIQTNSIGIIDEKYCGENDIWKMPVYSTKEVYIPKGTRIAQFRIIKHQPDIEFVETDIMADTDRGGFGSTGK